MDLSAAPTLTARPDRPATTAAPRRRRRWAPIVVLALVLVAGGVVVTKFLRSAVDYYCNVDEIGAQDGCEAGRRLRVQGTVDEGSRRRPPTASRRSRSRSTASTMPVRYEGEPGGIFQECVPVVVHGELGATACSTATASRSSTPTSTRPRTPTGSTRPPAESAHVLAASLNGRSAGPG